MLDLLPAAGRLARLNLAVLVLVPYLALGVEAAEAGRYLLEKGSRYQLCREYAATLAEAGNFAPDTWEWPVSPKFPDFHKPRWEVLEPAVNRDLILRLAQDRLSAKISLPEVRENNIRLFRQSLKEGFGKGQVRLERTRVDLDHSGTTETLYRIRLGEESAWGFYLDKSEDIDLAARYHERALTNRVDLFLYRGRAYLIVNHVYELSIVETQRVEPLNGLAAIPVCEFDYRKE